MDVRNAKPAEIDAVWFPLAGKLNAIENQAAHYKAESENANKNSEVMRGRYARDYERYVADNANEVARLKAAIEPLQAEWDRRGGWSRYVLCASDGGHFHQPGCHTLRPFRTRVSWIAELSGLSDNEVVEAVGFKACSQPECFPAAPVHPAWAASEVKAKETKQADRDARYAKGLATREKKVVNIEKRLAKARARLESADEYERSSAKYDIEWNERDLVWAKREVERWLAKR